jgi:hypothetical protein
MFFLLPTICVLALLTDRQAAPARRWTRLGVAPNGFTESPMPFIEGTVMEEMIYDCEPGFFHVTTNLASVLQEGRLLSRRELRKKGVSATGLGGGFCDEAADLVSVTYTLEAARRVEEGLILMARAAHGQVSSMEALGILQRLSSRILESIESEVEFYHEVKETGDAENLSSSMEGPFETAMNFDSDQKMLVQDIFNSKPGPALYKALQGYETFLADTWASLSGSKFTDNEDPVQLPVGFTQSATDFARIDLSKIAILKVAAREEAKVDWVPEEAEIRFKPEDICLVAVLEPRQ